MKGLFIAVLPILILTGLFVGAVYLFKYIIHRIVNHK